MLYQKNDDHKKTSITVRVDEQTLKKLHTESDQQNISLNTLLNQALVKYVKWHSKFRKAGFVAVRKQFLIKLTEKFSEDEIVSIAKKVATSTSKDIVLLLENEYNINSVIDFVESALSASNYSYNHTVTNHSTHTFTIQHEMGKKWSLYLTELYRFMFEEFTSKKIEFNITENTIYFNIDVASSTKNSC